MNFLRISFVLLFILVTILALTAKPNMHRALIVTDINYKIQETQNTNQKVEVRHDYVEPVPQEAAPQKPQQQKVIVQVIEEHVKTTPQTVKTIPATSQDKTITVQPTNDNANLLERVVKNAQESQTTVVPVTTSPVKQTTQEIKTQTMPVSIENKPLTEEEEVIAWNKWRSDLQNKIMKDTNIGAPLGTVFRFTFIVDKNGNVSNINTWSDNNNYTPVAKRAIKPVLLSYQHTAILNFPPRTKRVVVNVDGSFTLATSGRYSTPDDYSDYERIKR